MTKVYKVGYQKISKLVHNLVCKTSSDSDQVTIEKINK